MPVDRHKVKGARDQFAAAWKAYLRANPPQAPEVDAGPDELFMLMMRAASDDDGPAPAPAGGADDAVIGPISANTNCLDVSVLSLQYRPIQNVCILILSCRICLYWHVLVCISMYWSVLVCIGLYCIICVYYSVLKLNTD
jgi:hypothetical protein